MYCSDTCVLDACCSFACLFLLFHVDGICVAFLLIAISSFSSILYVITFCHIGCFVCTFCCIEFCTDLSYITLCRVFGTAGRFFRTVSVVIPSLVPLLALSIMSWTVIGVGAKFTRSIDKLFDILSSFMVTVLAKISTILNGPIFGDINLMYESVANRFCARGCHWWATNVHVMSGV